MHRLFENSKEYFHTASGIAILYAAAKILAIIIFVIFFGMTTVSFAKKINMVTGTVSSKEGDGPTFDLAGFAKIAPRLGINFALPASSAMPKKEEPQVQPIEEVTNTDTNVPSTILPPPPVPPNPVEFSLRILNSTSINGLSGTWKERFRAVGFKEITIGNADERDLSGMTVRYSPDAEALLPQVRDILREHGAKSINEEKIVGTASSITIIVGIE